MSSTGNSTRIVPRRQSSAVSSQAAETQYDGGEVPVLIRLPDLSAEPTPAPIQPNPPTPVPEPSASRPRSGSKNRRIDKPHARARKLAKQPSPFAGTPKSKVGIAAAVLVTAAATYFFMPTGRGPEEEQPGPADDTWSLEQIAEPAQVATPQSEETYAGSDLWPQNGSTRAQQPDSLQPPRGLPPQQPIAQQQSETWPAQARVSLDEPVDAGNAGGFEQVRTAVGQTDPAVTSQPSTPEGQWPDSPWSIQPIRSPVQQPDSGLSEPADSSPSQTGFPSGTRTGMRSTYTTPQYSNPSAGARLDGNVKLPDPTTSNSPPRRF